ncbi:hypothetical protein ACFODO_23515 [Acinetobacter sichuanensis]|uniref:Uncharacterized protein n=1 Tax=Acinetobacter sichuanensis TaxID=2136183 RepID=A0A371YPN8_9GAMM|nr:hypothetical protein [Acinetobacter sichuanensis]RFC83437.1 hypothetical protein C9E89_011345 [Acinetobacter sichuanensis]
MINKRLMIIANKLLEGYLIDQWNDFENYEFLNNTSYLKELNNHIEFLGKKCIQTPCGGGYFLVYLDIHDLHIKKVITKQLEENVMKLEPFIDWLRLFRKAGGRNEPLIGGDRITSGEILVEVEKSKHVQKGLKELSAKIGKTASTVKDQINGVLQFLVQREYLVPVGVVGTEYLATSRWSIFYEELQYIAEHNAIDTSQIDDLEQGVLI